MQVKDIMTRNVISVFPETPVTEVSQLLFQNRIHGVPVVQSEKVIGIITETDFFTKGAVNVYLPSYIEFLKNDNLPTEMSHGEQERIEMLLGAKAKDIMSSPCITIEQEADIEELFGLFKGRGLSSVPVVNKDGVLSGMVTLVDLIGLLKVK